jgi:hypothetical protein
MGIELGTDLFKGNYAVVAYTIDGVQVVKTAYPFSFARMGLSGTYTGVQILPGGARDDVNYSLTLNDSPFMMTTCGRRFQYGRQVLASGPYDCGGSPFGQMSIDDVYVTWTGFTGSVSFGATPGVNVFNPIGRIAGLRTGAH